MRDKYFSPIKNYPCWLRLGLFVLTLLLIWLPFVLLVNFAIGSKDANLNTIVTMAILFIIFLFLVPIWGRKVYQNLSLFKSYGLVNSSRNIFGLLKGLAVGFGFTWLLFIVESLFGWVTFQSPSLPIATLVLQGLASGLGVAFAEEIFFRGWLLYELERDFSLFNSAVISSLVFAILHFIKPLGEIIRTSVTFPALVLLGYILVVAKRSHSNLLGISIGLHGGLVWGYYLINVGEMVKYNDIVPTWITGIDRNPIAGVMGLIFLSILLYLISTFIRD